MSPNAVRAVKSRVSGVTETTRSTLRAYTSVSGDSPGAGPLVTVASPSLLASEGAANRDS